MYLCKLRENIIELESSRELKIGKMEMKQKIKMLNRYRSSATK